jgi:hypothetical protein
VFFERKDKKKVRDDKRFFVKNAIYSKEMIIFAADKY